MLKIRDFIKIRNNNFIELYQRLTGTDYKGNYNDTYAILMLHTMLAIDMTCGANDLSYSKSEMYELAIEVVRLFEKEDHTSSNYSIDNWARALLDYMHKEKHKYKDVHSTNTYDLRKNVSKYLDKGDE